MKLKERPPTSPGKNADLYLFRIRADIADAIAFLGLFTCDGSLNQSGFCDEAYDAQIDDARKAVDDDARFGIYGNLEAMLTSKSGAFPLIPLTWSTTGTLRTTAVDGLEPNALGLYDFATVSVSGARSTPDRMRRLLLVTLFIAALTVFPSSAGAMPVGGGNVLIKVGDAVDVVATKLACYAVKASGKAGVVCFKLDAKGLDPGTVGVGIAQDGTVTAYKVNAKREPQRILKREPQSASAPMLDTCRSEDDPPAHWLDLPAEEDQGSVPDPDRDGWCCSALPRHEGRLLPRRRRWPTAEVERRRHLEQVHRRLRVQVQPQARRELFERTQP